MLHTTSVAAASWLPSQQHVKLKLLHCDAVQGSVKHASFWSTAVRAYSPLQEPYACNGNNEFSKSAAVGNLSCVRLAASAHLLWYTWCALVSST